MSSLLLLLSGMDLNQTADKDVKIHDTDIETKRFLSFEAVTVTCEEVTLTSFIV